MYPNLDNYVGLRGNPGIIVVFPLRHSINHMALVVECLSSADAIEDDLTGGDDRAAAAESFFGVRAFPAATGSTPSCALRNLDWKLGTIEIASEDEHRQLVQDLMSEYHLPRKTNSFEMSSELQARCVAFGEKMQDVYEAQKLQSNAAHHALINSLKLKVIAP